MEALTQFSLREIRVIQGRGLLGVGGGVPVETLVFFSKRDLFIRILHAHLDLFVARRVAGARRLASDDRAHDHARHRQQRQV